MDEYDPMTAPDPEEWLALDEGERIALAEAYHRRVRAKLPASRRRLHAVCHVIVENQIADPTLPTRGHCERLLAEGLDRHDAIHELGSAILEQVMDTMRNEAKPQDYYWKKMEQLTAATWRASATE